MQYIIREVGKSASGIALIEAESIDEAIQKFGGVDETIMPWEKFSNMYFTGIYEVCGEDKVNALRIIHSSRVLSGYGYHGGGRKKKSEDGRVSFAVSCSVEEREEVREIAKKFNIPINQLVIDAVRQFKLQNEN